MNSLLDDLWKHAEKIGDLFPALVDAEMEIDQEFGDLLLWCYNNQKWPGYKRGPKDPINNPPLYWFLLDDTHHCYSMPSMNFKVSPKQEDIRTAFLDLYELRYNLLIYK